jgi:hypothetical protein
MEMAKALMASEAASRNNRWEDTDEKDEWKRRGEENK